MGLYSATCEAAVNNCAIDDPTDFDVAPSSRPQDSAWELKMTKKHSELTNL